MLISNKNSNRSENFTKTVKTKKKKKKEMIQRNNECLPISTIVPAWLNFSHFPPTSPSPHPRHGDTRKKIISANDRDKLNPDPRM